MMHETLFQDFLVSHDNLRVYHDGRLVFASQKDRLYPLLDYIARFSHHRGAVIFDRIMGNAAALLVVRAGGTEVYSPLGSELAIITLDRYGIKWHISEIVPCIQQPNGDMCPMEKLSCNKEPEEFYLILSRGG